jgi:hypothetical protein
MGEIPSGTDNDLGLAFGGVPQLIDDQRPLDRGRRLGPIRRAHRGRMAHSVHPS